MLCPLPQAQVGRQSGAKSGEGLWGGRRIEIGLQGLMEPGESSVGAETSSPTPCSGLWSQDLSGPLKSCQELPSGMGEGPQDPVVSNLSGDGGKVYARRVGK